MNSAAKTTKLAAWIVTLSLLAVLKANAGLFTFSQTVNTAIPDADPNGLTSTLNVSGVNGPVLDVSVVLNVAGTWNGDLYAYLSHGSSGFAVLLNRVGRTGSNPFGYGDAGFSITLNDAGLVDIHSATGGGSLVAGTYQPDARNVDPQGVLDTSARTAFLSSFNGLDPNGSWTLFFSDAAGDQHSTLSSWSLQIVVPEPITQAMILFGALLAAGLVWRHWPRKRASRP